MCAPASIHVYTQVMHLLLIPGFKLGPVTFPFKKAHYFFDPAVERRKPGAWPHVAENQNSTEKKQSNSSQYNYFPQNVVDEGKERMN